MLNQTAATGAILQMLSHGLMTALFFALIGMIYGRTHTRDVRELTGLMKVMPFLSVCYVIAGLANLGLPGLSGFIADMDVHLLHIDFLSVPVLSSRNFLSGNCGAACCRRSF